MLTRRQFGKSALAVAAAGFVGGCSSADEASLQQGGSAGNDVLARSIVFDLHIDTPARMVEEGLRLGHRGEYNQVDISRMREGGITAAFFAIYTSATENTPQEALRKALEMIDVVVEEVNRYPEDLILATRSEDVIRAKHENKNGKSRSAPSKFRQYRRKFRPTRGRGR